MTDRARHVYALLRTLLAWAPTPRSRTGLDRAPRGFTGGHLRYVVCPDCLTNDHPEGMHGCETCDGKGTIPDPGPDPYETKGSSRFLGVAGERAAEANRRRDLELERLAQQTAHYEKKVDEPGVDDTNTRALELRDRLHRHGSYAELDHALERIRRSQPAAYHVAMTVAYQPFNEPPIEPLSRVVEQVCELLAMRMPDPIRVPPFVPVWTADELKQRADRMAEQATWRGQRAPAARAQRNAIIRGLADEGLSPTKIADRLHLSKRTIERVLADPKADSEAA